MTFNEENYKIIKEFSQSMGAKPEKVHSIGSPIFDRLRFD